MTETLISPGVLAQETDTSFITRGPVTVGAAIVGPTAKGPVNRPTVVTTFSEYESIFGKTVKSGSSHYSYLTSISANNYFQQGGTSLLVTRVAEGTYGPATSNVLNSAVSPSAAFVLQTISEGTIMNNEGEQNGSGSLANGKKENIRWEVSYSDENSGTFNLIIRRGDDNDKNKNILEHWKGLSLDPNSPNYIESVIGNTEYVESSVDGMYYPQGTYANKSSYVIVKNVVPTEDYITLEGTANEAYKTLIPKVASGSFAGGQGAPFPTGTAKFYDKIDDTNTQGLIVSAGEVEAYEKAFTLLSNKEMYQFNLITAPGLVDEFHNISVTSLVAIASDRKDCLAVIDLTAFQNTVSSVKDRSKNHDTSYAATYWPWVQTIFGGKTVWVPASTMIPGVYAFTDASSEPWFAPAGMTRGGLGRVIQPERRLSAKDRDELYTHNINPIAYFPQQGVVVFGQKTMQKKASALDRINVRRLLIEVKSYISQIANTLVFEQNTAATRYSFLSQANPYLETIQQREGLYAFKVIMDESNNSADSIDRNELRGQILLQPTKTIEYILLDFSVTPTGVDFDA